MGLENISPSAIETVAQTIFLVVAIVASLVGVQIGRNKLKNGGPEEPHFELKHSIISDKKAEEIVRCLEENTRVMREKINAVREFCHAVHNLHETLKDSRQDSREFLREFRADIRDLIREIK